jgi:hypothetical protein
MKEKDEAQGVGWGMTDREMLELAAKAAGKEHYGEYNAHAGLKTTGGWWNPRDNGDDAFSLAVKLRMSVHITDQSSLEFGEEPFSLAITVSPFNEERVLHGDDPDAATRLAITRAAAKVGRSMR